MRKWLSALALLGSLGAAQAADFPTKAVPYASTLPAYSWDGFLAYGSAGFANLNSQQNFGQAIGAQLAIVGVPGFAVGSTQGATPSASTTGFFGGGGVGVQKAYGDFLIGARLDVDSFGQGTSVNTVIGQVNTNSHLFGTGNLRAGFTFDKWYLYGTGGVAWDRVCVQSNASSACNSGVGYMAGAGVEYDIPIPQWGPTAAFFMNVEYRFYKVDGIDAQLNAAVAGPIAGGVAALATASSTTLSNQDSLQAGLVSAGLKF